MADQRDTNETGPGLKAHRGIRDWLTWLCKTETGITGPTSDKSNLVDGAEKTTDPFQIFEVVNDPCCLLVVRVIRGRNITKGTVRDFFDLSDPYVVVHVPGCPEATQRTSEIDNNKNPEWNEELKFYMSSKPITGEKIALIRLMDANYTFDGKLGSIEFDISDVPEQGTLLKSFTFSSDFSCAVDIEFKFQEITSSDIRHSLALCDGEQRFRGRRKRQVYQAVRSALGASGPQNLDETPTIAVLGSGGGFRAMVGFAGVMKALQDSGILDCATYLCGLSGSSWYLSTLYSHDEYPENGVEPAHRDIRAKIESSPLWLVRLDTFVKCRRRMKQKKRQGQPVSFTDLFGMLIGEMLLGPEKMETKKLSHLQSKIEDANAPMPLLTCLQVRSDVSAMTFHEWLEFTPYEIGAAKYGSFLKTEHFGSKFYKGILVRKFDESPLHFLQGIWGSAFSILFERLFDVSSEPESDERGRLGMELADVTSTSRTDTSPEEEVSEHEIDTSDDDSDHEHGAHEKGHSSSLEKSNPDTDTVGQTKSDSDRSTFKHRILQVLDLLKTRGRRTGRIFNFMRGFSFRNIAAVSRSAVSEIIDDKDEFKMITDPMESGMKQVHVVDAGLTFNSPYPPMLRPQRSVDLIISFDFTARKSDEREPFHELLLAEKWARLHNAPFPKIDPTVYNPEKGMKECYVFRDEENEKAPIVIHFPLINRSFQHFSAPGVPRSPDDESGKFKIYDDPDDPFSTYKFQYSNESFDKLHNLMEFNTLINIEKIKAEIKYCVERLRKTNEHL